MRSYLILFIASLFLLGHAPSLEAQSVADRVTAALEKSDPGTLAACFHTMVDLQIQGSTGSFSQNQASVILKKFLTEHPVASVTLTKEGANSDGSNYALGELVSAGKKFRLYFVTREVAGTEKVMVFRVTEW